MKRTVKLKKVRFLFLVMWMTLLSNTVLGSSMIQFTEKRPMHLFDKCNLSFPGYSVGSSVRVALLWVQLYPTVHNVVDENVCYTNSNYYNIFAAAGVWTFSSYSQSSCYYNSNYYCFYKNNNY